MLQMRSWSFVDEKFLGPLKVKTLEPNYCCKWRCLHPGVFSSLVVVLGKRDTCQGTFTSVNLLSILDSRDKTSGVAERSPDTLARDILLLVCLTGRQLHMP
ncbi:hypothetical protein Hamer_G016896 [Homarus americanus]|uniref:Uncharacterized protein n=1 Tax=Homarus americanus TaxID=6706 RepID=A0A8J5N8P6_HOMAM|nr:hypothetical protein Hamer_G016896 [Homarus americanus]